MTAFNLTPSADLTWQAWEEESAAGAVVAQLRMAQLDEPLIAIRDLAGRPKETDRPQFRHVASSERHRLHRVRPLHDEQDVQVRVLVAFDQPTPLVVMIGDKAGYAGDWYRRIGVRADALIDKFVRDEREYEQQIAALDRIREVQPRGAHAIEAAVRELGPTLVGMSQGNRLQTIERIAVMAGLDARVIGHALNAGVRQRPRPPAGGAAGAGLPAPSRKKGPSLS